MFEIYAQGIRINCKITNDKIEENKIFRNSMFNCGYNITKGVYKLTCNIVFDALEDFELYCKNEYFEIKKHANGFDFLMVAYDGDRRKYEMINDKIAMNATFIEKEAHQVFWYNFIINTEFAHKINRFVKKTNNETFQDDFDVKERNVYRTKENGFIIKANLKSEEQYIYLVNVADKRIVDLTINGITEEYELKHCERLSENKVKIILKPILDT